jgi:hypothetical protein
MPASGKNRLDDGLICTNRAADMDGLAGPEHGLHHLADQGRGGKRAGPAEMNGRHGDLHF